MMGGESWAARDQFSAAVPSISAVWWQPADDQPRRLLYDRRSNRTPSASFAQVNAEMAEILRAYVLDRARSYLPESAVDAYSGGGDTAIALCKIGVSVTAIELDQDAVEWAASKLTGSSRAIQGRVEEELPAALPADLVILNPPRAGVDARVTNTLEASAARLRAVIYISCNPATLARDVSRLPSFRIESLRAFDMFPQTAHVETVCELRPSGTAA
jgi:23S rRNA (uracil1939-C5)-methyltransferase